jgi:hypothetical protein
MTRAHSMVVVALLMLAAGCRRDDPNPNPNPGINPNPNPGARGDGNVGRRDSVLTLGPGDVKITNEDSSVDMAVVGQQIIVRLSDKTMAKVREETDTSKVKDNGFSGSIERMVKRTVASALGQQYTYPLADVRDARYENGRIVLDVNGREPRLLANTEVGGKKVMESFRPEDAQRFVTAVNAKKSQKRAE